MTNILAVGCSFVRGHGLDQTTNDPRLWVNQLCQEFFDHAQIDNPSQSGVDNHWIFTRASRALLSTSYDVALVGWTSITRLYWHVGLESYHTGTMMTEGRDIKINPDITISGRWIKSIGDNLSKIQNDHWKILDLVHYVNILIALAEKSNTKIFFVNSLANWSDRYFDQKDFKLPSDLSDYEKNLLSVDTRDDEEIKKIYDRMHRHYRDAGGIQEHLWLNLYQSLFSNKQDTVSSTDLHPGYKSQDFYVREILGPALRQKLI